MLASDTSAPVFRKDPQLIIPKLLYLLLNLTIYSTHAFIGKYLKEALNLKIEQVGFIQATSLAGFVGAIFWANLADRFKLHKSILLFTVPIFSVIFCLQALVDWKTAVLDNTYRAIILSGLNALFYFLSSAAFPIVDNTVVAIIAQDPSLSKEMFGRQRLWGTIGHTLSVIISEYFKTYFSTNGWTEVDDSKAPLSPGKFFFASKIEYMIMLIWAALFTVVAFIGIPSRLEIPEHAKGHGHHGGHGGSSKKQEAGNQASSTSPNQQLSEESDDAGIKKVQSPVFRLMKIPSFVLILIIVFLAGYIRTIVAAFGSILLLSGKDKGHFNPEVTRELKTSLNGILTKALEKSPDNLQYIGGAIRKGLKSIEAAVFPKSAWLSFSQIAKLISELLVFFFGKQMMEWFGVYWMLLISQTAASARSFGYGFITENEDSKIYSLIWEFLKGISTGMFFSATVRIAGDTAPPGCGNTAQGIISAVYSGIASSAAGLIGGLHIFLDKKYLAPERLIKEAKAKGVDVKTLKINDEDSVRAMFFWTGIFGLGFMLFFFLYFALVKRTIFVGNRGKKAAGSPI